MNTVSNLAATNIEPINLESLPIEDLCVLEALYEASEKAGLDADLAIATEQIEAKIVEKNRQMKKTGKINTTIPPGTFGLAEVNGQQDVLVRL